jgi:hypothetical protein
VLQLTAVRPLWITCPPPTDGPTSVREEER